MKLQSRTVPNQNCAAVGLYITVSLLLGFCINTVSSLPWSCSNDPSPPNCPDDCDGNHYYLGSDRLCKMCLKCGPGEELDQPCGNGRNGDAACKPCEEGAFSSGWDYECIPCRICVNTVEVNTCRLTGDRECGDCLFGFFRSSSQFFDPSACPDRCASNNEVEPQCQEWWQQQRQIAMSQQTIEPQHKPHDNEDEAYIPHQIQLVTEPSVYVDKPEQQAAVAKDEASQGIPYVTIITALATLLVIVIIVFSLALGVVHIRKYCDQSKSETMEVKGRLLPESPLFYRSGSNSPASGGSPETGQKLSNYHNLPAGVWPYLMRPASIVSSTGSGAEGRSTQSSSADSKLQKATTLPSHKADSYPFNVSDDSPAVPRVACRRGYSVSTERVVIEGPAGIAIPYNNAGNTLQRRRSIGIRDENAVEVAPRQRRSSISQPIRSNTDHRMNNNQSGNGRHVGNGVKEPIATLFSEEPEVVIAPEGTPSIAAVRPDRPVPYPNDPQVPAQAAAATLPNQYRDVNKAAGADRTDVPIKSQATRSDVTRNQEKQKPFSTPSYSICTETSLIQIHINDVKKLQIGNEHHHTMEEEPRGPGNLEDNEEGKEEREEADQLLPQS